MPRIHTHYDNLKVARNAPPEVIRAAYRTLSKKYHPDHNPGNKESMRIIQLINAAYEVLSDPARREEHDRWIARMEEEELRQAAMSGIGASLRARANAAPRAKTASRRKAPPQRPAGMMQKLQAVFEQFARLLSNKRA